jgi:DNA-binding transcriptional LysR family regulator
MRFCAEAGFSPRVTQEVEQMHAIVGLVGAGLGVALVPASMRLMAAGDVVFASIARAPMVEMGLAWRADDPSPLVASFLAVARAHRPRRNAPP